MTFPNFSVIHDITRWRMSIMISQDCEDYCETYTASASMEEMAVTCGCRLPGSTLTWKLHPILWRVFEANAFIFRNV